MKLDFPSVDREESRSWQVQTQGDQQGSWHSQGLGLICHAGWGELEKQAGNRSWHRRSSLPGSVQRHANME
eukprot:12922230-Prorocentrum_lima.AAC.1